MDKGAGVGSRLRTAALVGAIFALAGATFDAGPVREAATLARYPFVLLLVAITYGQGATTRIRLGDTTKAARALITAAWLFVIAVTVLAPFAIAPTEALAQIGILVLLVTTMHVHVTSRWHHPGTVSTDIRTIFWGLALPVAASLVIGGLEQARLSGLFDNPNTLAMVSVMATALGLGLFAERRKPLCFLTLCICVAALLRTESRTAVVALLAAVVVLVVRRLRREIPPTLVIAMCFTGAGLLLVYLARGRLPVPDAIRRFGADERYGPLNTRELAWEYALDLWSREPLTGYGFRVGELAFQQNRSLTRFTRDGVHNSYLQTLLEVGVVGYLPFILMLGVLITVVRRCQASGIGVSLVALVVVGLATGVTESFLFGLGQVMSWTFWLVAAAAASNTTDRTPRGLAPKRVVFSKPARSPGQPGTRGSSYPLSLVPASTRVIQARPSHLSWRF